MWSSLVSCHTLGAAGSAPPATLMFWLCGGSWSSLPAGGIPCGLVPCDLVPAGWCLFVEVLESGSIGLFPVAQGPMFPALAGFAGLVVSGVFALRLAGEVCFGLVLLLGQAVVLWVAACLVVMGWWLLHLAALLPVVGCWRWHVVAYTWLWSWPGVVAVLLVFADPTCAVSLLDVALRLRRGHVVGGPG